MLHAGMNCIPTEDISTQGTADNVTFNQELSPIPVTRGRRILPRWGTLLQYGNAEVMRTFFSPCLGNLGEQSDALRYEEGKTGAYGASWPGGGITRRTSSPDLTF
jgi:hypothetical protein